MRARVLLAAVSGAVLVLGALAWDVVLAQAPWSENFDSYAAGSQMIGQGGWTGWDNNPAVGALVSNAFSRSNPHSVAITGATDLVHTYAGYSSGRAVYTTWQYIPAGFAGSTYFILMNQYVAGGAKSWSVQVHFDSATNRVTSDFDGNWLPLIRGSWVQIRVEIDLDTDTQTFYYNNSPLYTKSWRCGVAGCGPLPPTIAAVNLYANGASPVYYDDMSLDHALPSLTLAKAITSGNPYAVVGGTIGYSYTLTNSGNVSLFPPYSVTDNQAAVTCPAGPTSLSPGASVVCTASHTVTQGDLNAGLVVNTATATASDAAAGGNIVTSNTASQTATAAQNPSLSLAKSITSGNPYSTVGAAINYGYVIRNTGNISLPGPVIVADDQSTDETCPPVTTVGNFDGFLDPGESLTCIASHTVTQPDLDAGSLTNIASAAAAGTTSNQDTETATATQSPALTLAKSITAGSPYDSVGDVISYSFLVTNSGNVRLAGPVLVADDQSTDETCPPVNTVGNFDAFLDPGESLTCTASHTVTLADLNAGSLTNIASATAGGATSNADSQTAAATISDPAVTKSGDPATAAIGDSVVFTLVVTNTGPGDAELVTVTDVVPSFLTINSVTVTNPLPPGSVDVTGNTITIDFGTVTPTATCPPASGTSCYIVTIQTTVNSSATPPGGTNTASLTLDPAATDADPDNNADSALTTIVIREPSVAPETGFAPGRTTLLPAQPAAAAYSDLGELWLEIPSLGIRRAITGVPRQAEGWDITWLDDLAGYLEGTAFPTWKGNSVITGHVVLPSGVPGPFAHLDRLAFGNSLIVHAWGARYRYEVRSVSRLKPTDPSIFRHEERAWLTLVTCKDYDPRSGTYRSREVVRAVLLEIDSEAAEVAPASDRGR